MPKIRVTFNDPYSALAEAVIFQALQEAEGKRLDIAQKSSPASAERFLRSHWAENLCALAGIDFEDMLVKHEKNKKLKKSGRKKCRLYGYNQEQAEFIHSLVGKLTYRQIAALFNEKYHSTKEYTAIRTFVMVRKWHKEGGSECQKVSTGLRSLKKWKSGTESSARSGTKKCTPSIKRAKAELQLTAGQARSSTTTAQN